MICCGIYKPGKIAPFELFTGRGAGLDLYFKIVCQLCLFLVQLGSWSFQRYKLSVIRRLGRFANTYTLIRPNNKRLLYSLSSDLMKLFPERNW